MAVLQQSFRIATPGHGAVLDITGQVARIVSQSGIQQGIANVMGVGSTLGITTLEFEPGCVADLQRALEQIAPADGPYDHNSRWGDGNGYAHLRSALLGTSRGFPIKDGHLGTGTWQQIVLCDFDNRARERQIIVTIVGE